MSDRVVIALCLGVFFLVLALSRPQQKGTKAVAEGALEAAGETAVKAALE